MSKISVPPSLRQRVAEKFNHRCCYCQSQEEIAGMQFTMDHVIPDSLGGETVEENLCLACWDCNLAKQKRIAASDPETEEIVALFHPNQQNWEDHFAWDSSHVLMIGLTSTGRATVSALHLNRPLLMRARERWVSAGWHPPK